MQCIDASEKLNQTIQFSDWQRKFPDSMKCSDLWERTCDHGRNSSTSAISRQSETCNDWPPDSYGIWHIFRWTTWPLVSCWFYTACKWPTHGPEILTVLSLRLKITFRFVCRLTSPLILIVMGCVMYVNYRIQKLQAPVVLFGKMFSVNQLCVATNIAAIPILYLFGAGSIMFWVIGEFWILVLILDLTQ